MLDSDFYIQSFQDCVSMCMGAVILWSVFLMGSFLAAKVHLAYIIFKMLQFSKSGMAQSANVILMI